MPYNTGKNATRFIPTLQIYLSLEFEKDQATLKSLQYLYQLVFRFAILALDEGQQEQWPHTLIENTGANS